MPPIRLNEHRWTNEQRLAIFLLAQRFNLTKDQRAAVMNAAYRDDFTQTHASGLPSSTIEGQLRQRTRQVRAGHWDEIESIYLSRNAEGKVLLNSILRKLVHAAATALAIDVVPDLLMVHSSHIHIEQEAAQTRPVWSSPNMSDLVPSTDEVYKYGGKAYRVAIGSSNEGATLTDVLVCEPAICPTCSSAQQVAASMSIEMWRQSPFRGRPWVHSADIAIDRKALEEGRRLYTFHPKPVSAETKRSHSGGLTTRKFDFLVVFGDGFARQVGCCHFIECECGTAARERRSRRSDASATDGDGGGGDDGGGDGDGDGDVARAEVGLDDT